MIDTTQLPEPQFGLPNQAVEGGAAIPGTSAVLGQPPDVPPIEPPGEPLTCFIAGTKISKPGGTSENIESIKVGDIITTYNTKNGGTNFGNVKRLFHHSPEESNLPYYLIINERLGVTPNHELFTNGGLIQASNLNSESVLISENQKLIPVVSIEKIFGKVPTYNLEVEGNHTYFADGIAVHNKQPRTYRDYPPWPQQTPANVGGGAPMPWQWATAGQTLAGQAGGAPQRTPSQWQLGTNLAQHAGATGLPTQVPQPWQQGMAGTQQTMQTGLPTQMPDIWGQLGGMATQMAQTGAPTSQDPWYQQAKQVAGHDIAQSIGQAAEQAGLKGMRWSSPLARQAQEIAARRMGEVGLEWTGREMAAQEAARARQLQAMPLMQQVGAGQAGLSEAARQRQFGALPLQLQFGQGMAGLGEAARARQMQALSPLYQFGAGQAGLGESAQQRALQAAGQLAPLGQMAGQFPMDVAQRAMQMGGTMQQQQMAQIAPLLQNFLRMTPEASPWLRMAMGATQMPFTQTQQQYQQSPFSQLLGIAGMIPGLF